MSEPTASADRAVRAIERAVRASEGGVPGDVVVAHADDLSVLPTDILRAGLDRVLMGAAPEAGLEALL